MTTSRRQFLKQSALAVGAAALGAGCAAPKPPKTTLLPKPADSVMTVCGPIPPSAMGATLPHEHIMLDFIGADRVSRDRYDREAVFKAVLPHLEQLPDFGCRTLVECTPAYIGRDPLLLKELSTATELNLLTNTGFYGAGDNKFLPDHARTRSADELAHAWLIEWRDGIEDTGIRPGFIKIGVDEGPLSNLHRTLIRAAARTHLGSGLTIAAHSGDGRAVLEEMTILAEEGVSGSALIWVHAQNEPDPILHWHAAEEGAWVEFDHISPADVPRHVELVLSMKARGYLHRVLVSHDAGWYEVGVPDGGKFRPYDTLFTEFIPALRQRGFTEQEISLLLVANPRDAFTIRVRKD